MILLNPVVQVLALADPDRFQPAPGAVLQSMCRVAGNDGLPISLATVNDDAIGSAMTLERFPEEALGRWQIPMLTEPELDRIADALSMAR
jgi:hypothetical protein